MQLIRLYHTLKPLRWQQYWYRLWHPLKRRYFGGIDTPASAMRAAQAWPALKLHPLPVFDRYDPEDQSFDLLNIRQAFPEGINWNFTGHGLLWCYHLNYFNWLGDEALSVEARLKTIRNYPSGDYPSLKPDLKVGLAPYPVSLRGMNIIRFFLRYPVGDYLPLEDLYAQYGWLYHFPEYHLQGNHLWQNACSLICAGCYFQSLPFYKKGRRILKRALAEQVWADGGHIEGSPMYHSLLLTALLQCIELNTYIKSPMADDSLLQEMRAKAALMLGWLEQIGFSNGEWPQVNDSTGGMAPTLGDLQIYAASLEITAIKIPLKESGYRRYTRKNYELLVDAGSAQPPWQPGHAHSDELSFCLNVLGRPVVVDTGIHTYEAGADRLLERGSSAHNALSRPGQNASDVWMSFRMGKRAQVIILQEDADTLTGRHHGYGFPYTRKISLTEDLITLEDYIPTAKQGFDLMLHFHPDIFLKKYSDSEILAGNLQISLENHLHADIEVYQFCEAFNRTIPAQRLRIKAGPHTITRLHIKC